jgi:putative membrane protein
MPVNATTVFVTAALVLASGAVTFGHADELVTPQTLWHSWSFEPAVVSALVLTSALYARGVARLWAHAGRGRGIPVSCACAFAAGQAAMAIALVSPLDTLGGTLLSAHMTQHGLLAGVAPPLLILGQPGVALAWAGRGRPLHVLAPAWRAIASAGRHRSGVLFATIVYGAATWVWHAPALFGSAVEHDWVHVAQHLSFFVPALLFWDALLRAATPRRSAVAAAASFATFMHTGLLGGLITMAPEPLYVAYIGRTAVWHLTPLADQQLAGVLMWVPLGLPYVAAGLWLGSRLVGAADDDVPERATNVPVWHGSDKEEA